VKRRRVSRCSGCGGRSGGRCRRGDPLATSVVTDIGGGATELIVTRAGTVDGHGELPSRRRVPHRALPQARSPASGGNGRSPCTGPAGPRCLGAGTLRPRGMAAAETGVSPERRVRSRPWPPHGPPAQGLRPGPHQRPPAGTACAGPDRGGSCRSDPSAGAQGLPGLEQGREDIILAGAVICQELTGALQGGRDCSLSDWSLREGLLFDLSDSLREA